MTETNPTRRPGRPAKDNSEQVGRRYAKLVIRAILPAKDSHGRRALAVCDCGGVIETRLSRLKSGETTSCGCVKVLRFKEFTGRAADRLPEGMVSAIWEDHFTGQGRKDISAARDIKVAVVDEAIRRHQRELDTMLANGTAGQIYFKAGEKGGLEAAAASHSLPLISSRYLVMAASRKPAARPYVLTDTDGQAMACEFYNDRIADREQNYDLGIKQTGEFTFRELRRSKGQILGTLAKDYLAARQLLSGRLEIHQVKRLQPFVTLADATLSARQRRQKAGAIRIMKQRRKDAAFDRRQLELRRQLNSPEPMYQERMAA
jgi:hypothetical protein